MTHNLLSPDLNISFVLNSEQETNEFAYDIHKHFHQKDVIYLTGTLGAGKSTFARALIRALANDPTKPVPSPTFTLVQTYEDMATPLWHYDLYRLESPDESYELGLEDSLASAISLIEWPERLGTIKLPNPLVISMGIISEHKRLIKIQGSHQWKERLLTILEPYRHVSKDNTVKSL